jgi:hypothetical protein
VEEQPTLIQNIIVPKPASDADDDDNETLLETGFGEATEDTTKGNNEKQNNVVPTAIIVIAVSEPLFLICKCLYHHSSSHTNN